MVASPKLAGWHLLAAPGENTVNCKEAHVCSKEHTLRGRAMVQCMQKFPDSISIGLEIFIYIKQ